VTLADIDRTLAGFRQAIDSMGANLFELENDTTRQALQQSSLTGVTAGKWDEASRSLGQLWQWFTQFKDIVERAAARRGNKGRISSDQEAEVSRLLFGPSIELSAELIPLARRALLGPAQTTLSCRPDELLAQMSTAFDQVKATVAATGEVWMNLLPRLQQDEAAVAHLDQLAASLGEHRVPELTGVHGQLDALTGALATDPLSIDRRTVDGLEASLASVRRDLEELTELRSELSARLTEARALLAEIDHTVADGRMAHDEVLLKIAPTTAPAPVVPDPELAARLDQVAALAGRGEWRAARYGLTQWTSRATDVLSRARQVVAANRAPLDERTELRGRLEAYRAKANRLGLAEDASLAAQYDRAHDLLFTAPTDLAAAAELVRRYQQALPAVPRPREVPS
jgi:hypothetical protein